MIHGLSATRFEAWKSRLRRPSHVGTRALHLLARVAIRIQRPIGAKALVGAVGRLLPAYRSREAAESASGVLAGRGTCLSRSLVIAARLRGSEIVIATTDPGVAPFCAHAWVESHGRPLAATYTDVGAGRFKEIARLR